MSEINKIINKINENVKLKESHFFNDKRSYKFILLFLCLSFFTLLKTSHLVKAKEIIFFDKFEVFKFNEIKDKINDTKCSEMWGNQKEFLNGIIRKLKPKKILEIGVRHGGSSIIILNAIQDVKESKLYSIDLSSENDIGECLKNNFSYLMEKWTLFKGNIATEYMEQIGNNIDMVLIDTAHFEPGEILDFLIVLPFLKENAIAIFHDIANQITINLKRNEWAPYIIFNAIRGEKYLPSGNKILTHDIGAIKLDKKQNLYFHDYFRLLGGQWQYFPKEKHNSEYNKKIIFLFF